MKSLMRCIVLLGLALLLLSACGPEPTATPVPPNNPAPSTPTVLLQPTGTQGTVAGTPATFVPVETATARPLTPQPIITSVVTSVVTATLTPIGGNISYKHYKSEIGNWSIDYPQGWQTSVISPNVQFLDPSGNALIQVTYGELSQRYNPADLVQLASANLKTYFGDTYVQKSQAQQANGSTRIDFAVAGERASFNGQATVEQRGTGLYILMLLDKVGTEATYQPIFDHALQSYGLPAP